MADARTDGSTYYPVSRNFAKLTLVGFRPYHVLGELFDKFPARVHFGNYLIALGDSCDNGQSDQLGSAVRAKFLHESVSVIFDGPLASAQRPSDLLVRHACED